MVKGVDGMRRSYKEVVETALGWWLFLTGYLVLAVVAISILFNIKVGFDLRLAIPILLKWVTLIILFSFIAANVLYVYKYYLYCILPVKGFLRALILYFASFWLTVFIFPYTSYLIPYVRVWNPDFESTLAFIMIFLVVIKMRPQRHIKDPKGSSYRLPIEDFNKNEFKSFGVFHSGVDFNKEFGTPVYAVASGKVVTAWPYGINGNMIKIKHQNKFSTVYTHLNEIAVNYGQMVKKEI